MPAMKSSSTTTPRLSGTARIGAPALPATPPETSGASLCDWLVHARVPAVGTVRLDIALRRCNVQIEFGTLCTRACVCAELCLRALVVSGSVRPPTPLYPFTHRGGAFFLNPGAHLSAGNSTANVTGNTAASAGGAVFASTGAIMSLPPGSCGGEVKESLGC